MQYRFQNRSTRLIALVVASAQFFPSIWNWAMRTTSLARQSLGVSSDSSRVQTLREFRLFATTQLSLIFFLIHGLSPTAQPLQLRTKMNILQSDLEKKLGKLEITQYQGNCYYQLLVSGTLSYIRVLGRYHWALNQFSPLGQSLRHNSAAIFCPAFIFTHFGSVSFHNILDEGV